MSFEATFAHKTGHEAIQAPVNADAEERAPGARDRGYYPRAGARALRFVLKALGCALCVVGVGFGIWSNLRPLPVATAVAVRGHAVEAVFATATVEPRARVSIKSRVGGRIGEWLIEEGESVKAGQLLSQVTAPELAAELKRNQVERSAASQQAPRLLALKARAAAVRANFEQARRDEARIEGLVNQQALPSADLLRERAKREGLEAEWQSALAEVEALKIELSAREQASAAALGAASSRADDADVRAPIAGVVLARLVEAGETVLPGQPVLRIADTSRLHLRCIVDEADVLRVAVGQRVAVSLAPYPGKTLLGRVTSLKAEPEPERHSFAVDVELVDFAGSLRSGLTGEANIVVAERENVVLIPSGAVDATGHVWVVQAGRAGQRRVEIGVRDLESTEVVSGLAPGEVVIVDRPEKLENSARVAEHGVDSPLPSSVRGEP
jgi:HlyD family secretion protein